MSKLSTELSSMLKRSTQLFR